jgi:hypothetical protein
LRRFTEQEQQSAAAAAADDDEDFGEEGSPDAAPRGFTFQELVDDIQAGAYTRPPFSST